MQVKISSHPVHRNHFLKIIQKLSQILHKIMGRKKLKKNRLKDTNLIWTLTAITVLMKT